MLKIFKCKRAVYVQPLSTDDWNLDAYELFDDIEAYIKLNTSAVIQNPSTLLEKHSGWWMCLEFDTEDDLRLFKLCFLGRIKILT